MSKFLLPLAVALSLGSAATAGGFGMTLPNLDFPPKDTTTLEKACLTESATPALCDAAQ